MALEDRAVKLPLPWRVDEAAVDEYIASVEYWGVLGRVEVRQAYRGGVLEGSNEER